MISALIVAAGQGLRMGSTRRKQYMDLLGSPILVRTLRVFDTCPLIQSIVIVVPHSEIEYCRRQIVPAAGLRSPATVVQGGLRRQDSVFNGLQALPPDDDSVVLIHDGVRPLVSVSLIEACIQGAIQWGACIPTLEAVDTPKQVDSRHVIITSVPRHQLHMAQTPQAFKLELIRRAHQQARQAGVEATDDASLVEALDEEVHVVSGLRENIKITTPEDLIFAEAILRSRRP